MRHTTILAALGAAAASIALASPASAWQQPYGGCEEATLAPHSAGANDCRAHGWTIGTRLAVNPHAVVVGSGLPDCRNEDGSGQASACSWNFDGSHDGNGIGLSYWADKHDRIHYVWPSSPVTSRWHWVGQELADALAEGDQPGRHWERCITNGVHSRVIRVHCPDGYHQAA